MLRVVIVVNMAAAISEDVVEEREGKGVYPFPIFGSVYAPAGADGASSAANLARSFAAFSSLR